MWVLVTLSKTLSEQTKNQLLDRLPALIRPTEMLRHNRSTNTLSRQAPLPAAGDALLSEDAGEGQAGELRRPDRY
jgi:hypothetical protein